MFRQINVDLGNGFSLSAVEGVSDVALDVRKDQRSIGKARLVTDDVDVSCITTIQIDDEFVNTLFNERFTLGDIVIKFLLKFPTLVRKLEFRFILEVPDNLKEIVAKYHFNRGEGSSFENEILIRRTKIIPEKITTPAGIVFKQAIEDKDLPRLLAILRSDTYWQKNLTIDRLKMVISKSKCFFAFSGDEVVGFARVLTDYTSFASLWDAVVDEKLQRQGIGVSLMFTIFSDPTLSEVSNWILFTESAKGLYQKFGFVAEGEEPDRKLVHKLRLQDAPPAYMGELISATADRKQIQLNVDQAFRFLFGVEGKRANLSSFWKSVPKAGVAVLSHVTEVMPPLCHSRVGGNPL